MARRAADFGVVIDSPVRVDMKQVKARKDEIVARSNTGVTNWMKNLDNGTVFEGHGRLEGPNTVSVNGETLEAEKIFINVGARALVPEVPGLDGVDYLNNTRIVDLDVLPEHLIVIGGSYIGLEFAQMYRRFGSKVTVVEQGARLIPRDDEDVSEAIKGIMENEGVEVRLGTTMASVEKNGAGVAMQLKGAGGEERLEGSHMLVAVGRRPNTDDLGLDKAGVEVDERGYVTVDDQLRTNVPGIWAIGDCNGRGAFTHTSYNDYEVVAANLFDNDPRSIADRIVCYGLFIDPPLGRVGLTEQQVRASGRKALVAKMQMERVARARERSETQGFMKVLVDAESNQLLGAAILGIGGDEIAHALLDVMYAKAPYTTISRAVHIHPTVSELIPTMLGSLAPLE
jgi:pyruvate/2-oxoglutarate dehydrogenase complex dihydrolipoamide dehydrogenase (E3) component